VKNVGLGRRTGGKGLTDARIYMTSARWKIKIDSLMLWSNGTGWRNSLPNRGSSTSTKLQCQKRVIRHLKNSYRSLASTLCTWQNKNGDVLDSESIRCGKVRLNILPVRRKPLPKLVNGSSGEKLQAKTPPPKLFARVTVSFPQYSGSLFYGGSNYHVRFEF
jgi:hypothetical protein